MSASNMFNYDPSNFELINLIELLALFHDIQETL